MKCLILVLAICCAPAWAWELNYVVTIDSGSPRYAIPSEDLTFVPGGSSGNVRYHLTSFLAPFSGRFYFTSIALGGWDNYLVLYRNAFNPATPLVNAVVANDNNPTVGTAGFTASLTGGERYFVVSSATFNSGSFRQANNTISSAVPEPTTFGLVGLGLFFVGLRRLSPSRRTSK